MAEPHSESDFLHWVGRCITRWADVDDALFAIFSLCLGGRNNQSAILYYRISGLEPRFATVDELVRSVLPARERKEGSHNPAEVQHWEKTIQGYQNLLHERRLIAHQPLHVQVGDEIQPAPNALLRPAAASYIIYTNAMERLRAKKSETKLDVGRLIDHDLAVLSLSVGLWTFHLDILWPHVIALRERPPSP